MLYVSICDETSKVKGKSKVEIKGENVRLISNRWTQRSTRPMIYALIGGVKPVRVVGPYRTGYKREVGATRARTPRQSRGHPTSTYRSRRAGKRREAPPPCHSRPSPATPTMPGSSSSSIQGQGTGSSPSPSVSLYLSHIPIPKP